MLTKLGLEHHTVHNARHSFCSIALEAGTMTIKEISKLLNTKESYIKNLIYRTLNELCLYFKECD